MIQSDLRDNEKVATLPDDLKSIADKMLEEKFKLPVRGEAIQEDPKVYGVTSGTVAETTIRINASHFGVPTLSRYVGYKTQEEIANTIHTSIGEWLGYWFDRRDRWLGYPYIIFRTQGMHTKRMYTHMIDPYRIQGMGELGEQYEYMKHIHESMQREYLEPLEILHPSEYR